MLKPLLFSLALASLAVLSAHADDSPHSKVTLVFDYELPNVPGKSMRGVLVEYPPNGKSSAHVHPNSAFIYATVLEGVVKSQVNNGPVTTYTAGQGFPEYPGDHHSVSANASATESAKLLAVFVVDTADKQLVTNDPE